MCTVSFFSTSSLVLLSLFQCGLFLLDGVIWYPIVVSICIFIISDVEHFFTWLLAICLSSLEKYFSSSSAHFLTGLYALFLLIVSSLKIFWYQSLICCMVYKHFLLFSSICLCFDYCLLLCAAFWFDVIPAVYLLLCFPRF